MFSVLLCIFGVVLAAYLLMGVIKEKAKWVEIYLWGKLIFLVYELITIVYIFFHYPGEAIWLLVVWCLEIYFWLCINSYYLDLKSGVITTTTSRTITTVITA